MEARTVFGFCLLCGACSSAGTGGTTGAPKDSGVETPMRSDAQTDSGVTVVPDAGSPPVAKLDASPDRISTASPDTKAPMTPDAIPAAVPDAVIPMGLQPVALDTAPVSVAPDADIQVASDAAAIPDTAPVAPDVPQIVPDTAPVRVLPDAAPDVMVSEDLRPAAPDTSSDVPATCGGLNQVCCPASALPAGSYGCSAAWTVCLNPEDQFSANMPANGKCTACGDTTGPGGNTQLACYGTIPTTTTVGYFCKSVTPVSTPGADPIKICLSPDAGVPDTSPDTLIGGGLNQPCILGLAPPVRVLVSSAWENQDQTSPASVWVYGCTDAWTTCYDQNDRIPYLAGGTGSIYDTGVCVPCGFGLNQPACFGFDATTSSSVFFCANGGWPQPTALQADGATQSYNFSCWR
jgi:hypothetical protein